MHACCTLLQANVQKDKTAEVFCYVLLLYILTKARHTPIMIAQATQVKQCVITVSSHLTSDIAALNEQPAQLRKSS